MLCDITKVDSKDMPRRSDTGTAYFLSGLQAGWSSGFSDVSVDRRAGEEVVAFDAATSDLSTPSWISIRTGITSKLVTKAGNAYCNLKIGPYKNVYFSGICRRDTNAQPLPPTLTGHPETTASFGNPWASPSSRCSLFTYLLWGRDVVLRSVARLCNQRADEVPAIFGTGFLSVLERALPPAVYLSKRDISPVSPVLHNVTELFKEDFFVILYEADVFSCGITVDKEGRSFLSIERMLHPAIAKKANAGDLLPPDVLSFWTTMRLLEAGLSSRLDASLYDELTRDVMAEVEKKLRYGLRVDDCIGQQTRLFDSNLHNLVVFRRASVVEEK